MASEKKLFPRSTSGLARGLGPVTAILITLAFTVGFGWQVRIYQFTGVSALPENLWFAGIPPGVMSFIIGGFIFLIITLGYSVLTSAMPRSGGGYVAISRIISPFAAFIGSWLVFFSIAFSLGVIAVAVFESSLYVVGPSMGLVPMPTSYNDVGFFAGGVLFIILSTAIVALGVRITGYVLQAIVWIPTVLGFYVLYLLGFAIANPPTLQNGISAWAQAQGVTGVTADTYVRAALAQGLDAANVGNYWIAVSVSLLGVYWTYVGYAALTFVAGEVRNPDKNFPKVVLLAPVVVMVMYVAMAAFGAYAASSVGQITLPNGDKWSFFDAYSYLCSVCGGGGSLRQAGVPNIAPRIPVIASMVGMGLGLGSLNILLFIFSILWMVNDLPAMALVGSRILFAMSFDRVLPGSLSRVNYRFHSPIYATVLVGVFAVLGALGETCVVCSGGSWSPSGPIGDILTNVFSNGVFATDLLDAVFFSLFSLALVLFPFRQKRIFESAPFKPGGTLGVTAIGLAGLIANLVIAWLVLTSPQDYNILSPTPANWFALEFTALLGVIGTLIYAYYRFGPSSKRVDYSTIFSEIPPE